MAGTPQGGVISPLLSNIYLHVLDRVWEDRCAHLGTLVRYADDFVVMCDTKAQVEEARRRVSTVLTRLGLELHPEKTRTVDLSRGREGFDFLGCHLRKRMSGPDLGADAATRLLPAAVAVAARDGAGARPRARADASRRGVTRTSAASLRTSIRCSAAGASTFARAMRRTQFIQTRPLRRGPAARPAR